MAQPITKKVMLVIPSRQWVPVKIGRKLAVPNKPISKPRSWTKMHVNRRFMELKHFWPDAIFRQVPNFDGCMVAWLLSGLEIAIQPLVLPVFEVVNQPMQS